jgi:hypothetical protein
MSGLRLSKRPWFLILIFAVVMTRLSGIHLHLCFDGLEPPASIHVTDGGQHNDAHHIETSHTDKDVEVFDAVLTKSKGSMDLPILFGACLLLLLLMRPTGRQWPPDAFYRVFPLQAFALRPPSRGPPR